MLPLSERTAILLEIVSFFLVTLDLYGEERVAALNLVLHRGVAYFGKGAAAFLNWGWSRFTKIVLAYVIYTLTLSLLYAGLYAAGFVSTPVREVFSGLMSSGNEWVAWLIFAPVLALLASMLLLLHAAVSLAFLWAVFGAGAWLLSAVKLRGVLLGAGTVLFLASKAVSLARLQ